MVPKVAREKSSIYRDWVLRNGFVKSWKILRLAKKKFGLCTSSYILNMCIRFVVGFDVDANLLSWADMLKLLTIDTYVLELFQILLMR